MMKPFMLIGCLYLLLAGATERAWGGHLLSDEEMDRVTAGALSVGMADGTFNFLLGGNDGSKLSVEGSGTVVAASTPAPPGMPGSYIILRDNAQSNLHAFVNVNAVNSKVQVLINLTVNINSHVGTIHQTNTVPGL